MGSYLDSVVSGLGIPILTFCTECHLSQTTYYRIKNGSDHNLNVYARFLEGLSRYCNEQAYLRIEHEFITLARAEVCLRCGEELQEEVGEVWRRHAGEENGKNND